MVFKLFNSYSADEGNAIPKQVCETSLEQTAALSCYESGTLN